MTSDVSQKMNLVFHIMGQTKHASYSRRIKHTLYEEDNPGACVFLDDYIFLQSHDA